MERLFRFSIPLAVAIALGSCSYDDLAKKFIPQEESEFAKDYIERLRRGEFEYVKSLMSPELLADVNDDLLFQMANYFRGTEPISTEIIGSQVNSTNSQWQGDFTFEYEFESGWNLANAALRKSGDGYQVTGLNVYRTLGSQRELNTFTLASKSLHHYTFLGAVAVVPLFVLVTLVFCIRTPIAQRKWLWIGFVLLGVGQISINWTTGDWATQLLSVHLLGASAFAAGPHAPWVLSISIPLGAIVFWIKREELVAIAPFD